MTIVTHGQFLRQTASAPFEIRTIELAFVLKPSQFDILRAFYYIKNLSVYTYVAPNTYQFSCAGSFAGSVRMAPYSSHRRGIELLKRAQQVDDLDLTVFMPCRNEQGNVSRALNEVVETLRQYKYTYEIIVVDDGSTDKSLTEINTFVDENPSILITVKHNEYSLGVSYNLTDAAVIGRGRYFIFIGSAFQNRRDTMMRVFDELGNADIILTSMDPDCRAPHRRWLSRRYTQLVNMVSGYDVGHYHGTPLFRRIDVVRWHSYRTIGFYADMITRMLDEGVSYIEVPTACYDRERGSSRALRVRNVISLAVGFSEMLVRRFSRDRVPPQKLPPRGRGAS